MSESNGAAGANVGDKERIVSLAGGGALAIAGIRMMLKERSPLAVGLIALGSALLYRGATKHCPMYEAAGIDRDPSDATNELGKAVKIEKDGVVTASQSVTINRPAQELYDLWRSGERLPEFIPILQSVHMHGEDRWEWIGTTPSGQALHWNTEVTEDKPGKSIRWHAVSDNDSNASAAHSGGVSFKELSGDKGTEVTWDIKVDAEHSILGAALAALFSAAPEQFLLESLRSFKQLAEAGELQPAQS